MDKKIKVFSNSIRQWKEISKMTDKETENWNGRIIKKEGMKLIGENESIIHNCFLCEYEHETGSCPLGRCDSDHASCMNNYTYKYWDTMPTQRDAKTFYYELWLVFLNEISERN